MTILSNEESTIADVGANFIAHYGVKGMKWGVRKDDSSTGQAVVGRAAPGHASADSVRANHLLERTQTHGTGSLSNKEMDDLLKRMNLEQRYTQAMTQKRTISTGEKFALKTLKQLGPVAVVTGLAAMAERSGNPQAVIAAKVVGIALGAKSLHNISRNVGN